MKRLMSLLMILGLILTAAAPAMAKHKGASPTTQSTDTKKAKHQRAKKAKKRHAKKLAKKSAKKSAKKNKKSHPNKSAKKVAKGLGVSTATSKP